MKSRDSITIILIILIVIVYIVGFGIAIIHTLNH